MAEGEQRRDLGVVVVLVPDVQALAVQYLLVLTRPCVPCRGVLNASWKRGLRFISKT